MKLLASAFVAILALSGCQSAYYAAWEKVGVEKRDILVDRVENAKESQEDAQEQFNSALEAFSAAVAFDGGELEDVYNRLNGQYEDSVAASEEVSSRIDKVESVAEALFDEWSEELEKYENASLKRDSAAKLRETKRRYSSLMTAMRKAESKMPPVLSALQDNASAIGALQGELSTIENNVAQLIRQMNSAIAESDAFISSMKN